MAEGRKMALIPLDMLQQIKQPNLMPIKNPSQDKLLKTMGEMKNILDNDSIPEDVKSNRFNNHLKDYSVFADKFIPPIPHGTTTTSPIQENVFRSLPKTFQGPAHVLMKELENFPNIINWDTNKEVTIEGQKLKGSNIIDLIGDVLRNRKTLPPVHSSTFLKMMADLNIPEEFIKNKGRISKFQSYKKGTTREHQVERAKRILAKKTGPPPRKRKFPWKSI